MTKYRNALPQLGNKICLTDGGLETTLVFHQNIDLPCFASYPLILDEGGREQLRQYFRPYLEEAGRRGCGFILDTATWRANPDWAAKLGHTAQDLARINRASVEFAQGLRDEFEKKGTPIVIEGVIGPRGDGYRPDVRMSIEEAREYHSAQIEQFRDAGADMVAAITMNYVEEGAGIALAAKECGMPVAISFTVETDGRLPSGDTLASAIESVDRVTGSAPAYYMINCAHPEHFAGELAGNGAWMHRIRGLRANASTKSHAELDASTELDIGNPAALAQHYSDLRHRMGQLTVLGGCCGTDHRHLAAISDACLAA
jgi:homocysteine S-methyltransferase